MSEWQMLADAEEIVRGDLIVVEKEDGRTMRLKFVGIKEGKYVMLKDGLDEQWHFCIDSLEEIDGKDRVIIGKYEAE